MAALERQRLEPDYGTGMNQRGGIAFDVIKAVAIAAVIGTVLGGIYKAWTSFKEHVAAPYVQAQMAADQKVIDAANAKQKQAESDRDTARANFDKIKQTCDAQSAEVKNWRDKANQNALEAARARDQARKQAQADLPRIAQLQADASAKPKLMACEDRLKKIEADVDEGLRLRRGLPPKGAK